MCKFGHDSEELLLIFAINMIIITTIIIQIGQSWKKIVSLDGGVHSISSCIATAEVDKWYLCLWIAYVLVLIPGARRTGEAHPAPTHFLNDLKHSFCSS